MSASPSLPILIACPVPTAITRTFIFSRFSNTGKSLSRSPEFSVEVVVASLIFVSAKTSLNTNNSPDITTASAYRIFTQRTILVSYLLKTLATISHLPKKLGLLDFLDLKRKL